MKKQASNERIIKDLSQYLSGDFNSRIPEPTKANMNQIAETIESYPTLANEFVDVLTNQIIRTMFMTKTIENPLKFFEKGTLSQYGKSLELIYVDLIQGKDFTERFGSSFENELLGPTNHNNVKVQYLTENSRLKYKTTISTDMLASAFRNENGLSNLVNQQVAKMVESYNLDKFLMTWKLIDKMNKVDIATGIDGAINTEQKGKDLLRNIKKVIKNMAFPSKDYNTSGVWTVSKPEDLAIIIDTETSALLDVEVLAGVFNLSKVEMASRIIEIPQFGDQGNDTNRTQALIVDKDKLQIYQTKFATDSIKNGAGLYTNIFLHKWDLFGACDFANCVRLSKAGKDGKPRAYMPYNVMPNELVETEMEISDGEIKTKKERKIK